MNGLGLVFAGGGGKGAYQIGVWKYLYEHHLDQYVQAVSGTSVGALNAALFVSGNYEQAEKLWLNLKPEQILTPRKITEKEIEDWLMTLGFSMGIHYLPIELLAFGLTNINGLKNRIENILNSFYVFSRSGILEMMDAGADFCRIQNAGIPCFATCLELPDFSIKRFDISKYPKELAAKILLASSAIPIIFGNEKIQGKRYCDGGFLGKDNVPIQPLYDLQLEHIIVVHLDQKSVIDRDQYPNAHIYEIHPQNDLGNFITGTIDFTSEGASRRLLQGYHDIKTIMDPMIDRFIHLKRMEQQYTDFYSKEASFCQYRNNTMEQSRKLKQTIEEHSFQNIYSKLKK